MIQMLEQKPTKRSISLFGGWTEPLAALSEQIIPAVPGEYYAYTSKFTDDEPVYALLKCKSNKFWSIAAVAHLGAEANLLFRFKDTTSAQVCSTKTACASGLLGDSVNSESFGETWIASTDITAEEFHRLHLPEKVQMMVGICDMACSTRQVSTALKPGSVVAMKTGAGKYGMFLVRRLTTTSIHIDACHILL